MGLTDDDCLVLRRRLLFIACSKRSGAVGTRVQVQYDRVDELAAAHLDCMLAYSTRHLSRFQCKRLWITDSF